MKNCISRGVFFTLTTGLLFILLNLLTQTNVYAQKTDNLWTDVPGNAVAAKGIRLTIPQKYRTLSLNVNGMRGLLAQAPHEKSTSLRSSTAIVTLPLPDGKSARFRFVENSTMAPDLAARFPEIRTFTGVGVDDRSLTATFDFTPAGFHGMIHSVENGLSFIDPYSQGDIDNYIVYAKKDYVPGENKKFIEVGVIGENSEIAKKIAERVAQKKNLRMAAQGNATSDRPSGDQLRTYRAAIAATAEYTAFHGGTVSNALAAINTTLNRVNFIYIREVAIKMQLVSNETNIIYTSNPDPYSNGNGGAMLDENQSNINAQIGSANYDIGHVFGTNSGGVAYLGVICDASYKARGVTGSGSPIGDAFDVDYVAHEMGHQFGANHTFNGSAGSCSGNRNAGTAFEPGSGSTIMSYAGICSPQDLQRNSDAYFHVASYDEIFAYSEINEGNSCAVVTSSGNTAPAPTIVTTNNLTIPKQTPFTITGSATDIQNDPITYNWEQYDLGTAGSPTSPSGNAPIFRSFTATSSASRTFPKLSDLLNNTSTIGETLPTYARALKFNLTLRDNYPFGGGVDRINPLTVNVSGTAGPFLVTSPNTNISMSAGTVQTVNWNISGTNASPINCTNVNILLSTNGGVTFPTVLVSNTENDGSQDVLIPNITTSTARIKVEAVGNIFFDISNVNFSITGNASNQFPTVSISSPANNTNYTSPASITINASASDPDGTISKVDFYSGSTLLGTDATSPYSFAWNNVGAGSYSLTAKATDNLGAFLTSSAVSVTVSSATNQLPTVGISSPVNNTNYTAPANITIDAFASDPDGSVNKVDFYNGTTLLGTDFTSPYSFIWTGVPAGSYQLTARATDDLGAMTTSTAVPVTVSGTVTPPNVSLTSPVNNSTYTAPATIFIAASATSPAGTVTNVQFYNGNTLLGSDGTRPFEYSWTSVPAGTYSITAKATDNLGGVATTPAATVTVNSPISIPTITSIAPTSGPAGVGVAIKGTNFTNVSAIRFNGITATETYLASPTLLYATVPAGATTGRIQVVAQDGSALSAASFSVAAISSRWTSRTRAAVARIGHGTIATNGRIYVFGGMNSTGVLNSLEIYNPSTNTWSSGAPMPVATGGMSFVLGSNGYIYMFGGITSTHVSTTYRYTPSTNTWTALAGMPVALFEAAAAGTTNGKIYVFGGEPSTALGTSTSGTWIYDIATNTWSTGANMPLGVQQHSAITGADGRIYIIGGRSLSSKEPVGLVQIYNPTTNTWTSGAAMPLPKVQFGAVRAADNRIYIIGGKAKKDNSTGPYFHSVEIYNPSTNTWATGPVIRVPLGQQTAAKLSDNLYAISGSDDTVRNYNFQLILPPVAPATLTATAASSSQINLKWTDKALNETSQVVERATASSGPFAAIATLGVNAVSYSNTGLSGNVTYYYRIKATNSAGSSTYSNTAGATTPVAIVSARGSIGDQTRQVNNLSVSPNPANKQTRISFSLDRDQKVHLLMYNMEGKVIDHLYEGNAVAGKKYQFNWNVGSNASGIYITTLRTEKAVYHQKVMVLP